MPNWNPLAKRKESPQKEKEHHDSVSTEDPEAAVKKRIPKWSLGMLQDKETDEVPGSVVLLSKDAKRNEPLGLQHAPARTSSSSLPSPYGPGTSGSSVRSRSRSHSRSREPRKKKTADGKIVLEPQPDDSGNDPLNWPMWRRNASLLSLGFYCMVGGGMTPILAAGFQQVAETYDIEVHRVALSTGLYMMGMGVGGVIVSPTAIQFGKRPVYLVSCVLFIVSSVWCAVSPNFGSLIAARIFQGMGVSTVEVLPSATIAEIFFLHERAYRLGIYTLLLLGGKNLIPLVSAAIIQSLGWRWVFWIVAIMLGFGGILLFFFVPETFWDRTPRAKKPHRHHHLSLSGLHLPHRMHRTTSAFSAKHQQPTEKVEDSHLMSPETSLHITPSKKKAGEHHVAFNEGPAEVAREKAAEEPARDPVEPAEEVEKLPAEPGDGAGSRSGLSKLNIPGTMSGISTPARHSTVGTPLSTWKSPTDWDPVDEALPQKGVTPDLHNLNSPWYAEKATEDTDYFAMTAPTPEDGPPTAEAQQAALSESHSSTTHSVPSTPAPVLKLPIKKRKSKNISPPPAPTSEPRSTRASLSRTTSPARSEGKSLTDFNPSSSTTMPILPPVDSPVFNEKFVTPADKDDDATTDAGESVAEPPLPPGMQYTEHFRAAAPKTYKDTLKPYHGRLSKDNWFRIALRPFILFAYPSILWSALVYSLSVGWLIVLSESVAVVYKNSDSYNFDSIQTGLVYISPFVGGILGTAVAGKVSDIIVRFMARRNDGVYEPEFRLVMAIPVAITTVIGLMGFGWSAEERDMWFVPTFFFGVISFGCSLGSTTAITFAVDSYRQYAGEALVTLNFAKNIFHGLVFSLFFTNWLEHDGSKEVFIAVGAIQLACMAFTIPMYIYGKRARMWTVRKNLMEKF